MNLPHHALKAFPHWNRCRVSEADVRRVAKRRGVMIVEGEVGVPGLHVVYRGVAFIVIRPTLRGVMRTWVLLHELFHFILHEPGLQLFDPYFETKADREANFCAAVALLPREMLERKARNELLEDGYPAELLDLRKEILEQFKM
jgi:Zn-dependent peptidase ImmA (M78 family)